MLTIFLIYFAGVAEGLKVVLVALPVTCFVVMPFAAMILEDCIGGDVVEKFVKKTAKKILTFGILSVFLAALVPSKETIYAIAVLHNIEQVAKSETSQRVFDKSMQALEIKLDEIISDEKSQKEAK